MKLNGKSSKNNMQEDDMVKEELIQRSPLRLFEKSIHGGLKPAEIGIIASARGIGKTSVLVQLALDNLLQGKKVIHVSFAQHTHYVLAWYEDIFDEFINKKNLENTVDVKDDVVKNRVLMNFSQKAMSKDQIVKSLRALITEGGFRAEEVIIDGFDFSSVTRESIVLVRDFARELGLSVWYSCTVPDPPPMQYDEKNVPILIKGIEDLLDIIIVMEPKDDHVELLVSKDRDNDNAKDMSMQLDPNTLLILER
jgi:hypothetical protein